MLCGLCLLSCLLHVFIYLLYSLMFVYLLHKTNITIYFFSLWKYRCLLYKLYIPLMYFSFSHEKLYGYKTHYYKMNSTCFALLHTFLTFVSKDTKHFFRRYCHLICIISYKSRFCFTLQFLKRRFRHAIKIKKVLWILL